jgi:hypothetical protein
MCLQHTFIESVIKAVLLHRTICLAVSAALLTVIWTSESHARDILTVYYSATATGPMIESVRSEGADVGGTYLQIPSRSAWVCHFSGTNELRQDAALTFTAMLEPSGGTWLASGTFSVGGLPYVQKPSYFHMVTKGTALIVGAELSLMVVMTFLPREVTRWEDDFVADASRNLGRHLVTAPIWDEDDWRLNYLGHPYAGNLYYNTVRAQGASPGQSFLFSFFASTFWEYVVEAVAEPASIQDLIVTPVAGSILGELSHRATLAMKKNGTSVIEGIIMTLINPTHVVMNGYH